MTDDAHMNIGTV